LFPLTLHVCSQVLDLKYVPKSIPGSNAGGPVHGEFLLAPKRFNTNSLIMADEVSKLS
jgi:hypothetical protein